jgi:hypothetical protein
MPSGGLARLLRRYFEDRSGAAMLMNKNNGLANEGSRRARQKAPGAGQDLPAIHLEGGARR